MKKMIMAVAIVCAAAFANAATVGWNVAAGSATYGGDAYKFFVIGQNGVESIATVTALLDAGTSVDTYAFGQGNLAANGTGSVLAGASGKTLEAGTYTAFAVIFDTATPTAGTSKYAVISGAATLTKAISATTASTMFATGSAANTLAESSNWKSFGSAGPVVPEPTSGLLLLLGMAGLALKRKVA